MTVFEDLLTGNKYQEEFVTATHGFQYKNHTLHFQAARVKVEYDLEARQILKLSFEARLTQTAEALQLRQLLKQSGYQDIREVSALLNTPQVEFWMHWLAPEALRIQATATGFFEQQDVKDLFVSAEGPTVFNQLDHYALEKISVNSQ